MIANGKIKLDIADLLEIGDLLEQWLNQKLLNESQSSLGVNDKETAFMEKLERVLDDNHTDPDFGLQKMAFEMYMSARQLQRMLKTVTGHHPAEFLRAYRLKKARELLQTGSHVGLASDAVGFSSPAYFTTCFKAQFGLTPSEYQQQFR
jgi:AraC-like DNA-binding protein